MRDAVSTHRDVSSEFIAVGASRFGAWLVGEDAYEGLNAFMNATLVSEDHGMDMRWAIEGWVFDEEPWPKAVPEG